MKKYFFSAIMLLFIASSFISCTKDHIKNDKRLIATWVLESETLTENYTSNTNYKFTPVNECFTDYTYIYKENSTINFSGTTRTKISEGLETSTLEEESESSIDTTIYSNYSYEITFNEDGTFSYTETYIISDENDSNKTRNESGTGYWNWIDAAENKIGIQLQSSKYQEGGINCYIETLDKEEMIISFEFSYDSENNSSKTAFTTCIDDITIDKTENSIYKSLSSGTQTFKVK